MKPDSVINRRSERSNVRVVWGTEDLLPRLDSIAEQVEVKRPPTAQHILNEAQAFATHTDVPAAPVFEMLDLSAASVTIHHVEQLIIQLAPDAPIPQHVSNKTQAVDPHIDVPAAPVFEMLDLSAASVTIHHVEQLIIQLAPDAPIPQHVSNKTQAVDPHIDVPDAPAVERLDLSAASVTIHHVAQLIIQLAPDVPIPQHVSNKTQAVDPHIDVPDAPAVERLDLSAARVTIHHVAQLIIQHAPDTPSPRD